MSSPSGDRRPQRRSNLIRFAGGLLVTCVLLVSVTVRTDTFERWVRSGLARAMEATTGERVTMGEVSLRLARRRFHVRGLMILDRETGETIFALRELDLRLAWGLGDRPWLSRVTLREPMLELHVEEDGLREFPGLRGREAGSSTPWGELAVEGGSVVVHLPTGEVAVQGITVAPRPEGGHRVDLSMDRVEVRLGDVVQQAHQVEFPRATVALDEIHLPRLQLAFPMVEVSGDARLLPAEGAVSGSFALSGELHRWQPLLPETLSLQGGVEAEVEVSGSTARPEVRGTLALEPWKLHREVGTPTERVFSFPSLQGGWHLAEDGALVFGELTGPWAEGEIALSGQVRSDTGARLEVRLRGARLLRILQDTAVAPTPWVDLRTDLHARLDGTFSPLLLEGDFEAESRDFRVCTGPAEEASEVVLALPRADLRGSLSLDAGEIRIGVGELQLPASRGEADVSIGFSPEGPLKVDARFGRVDLGDFGPLGGVDLQGRGGLRVRVEGPFHGLEIRGEADVDGLRVLDVPFADHAELAFRTLDLRVLEFPEFRAWRGHSRYSGNLALDFDDPFTLETQVLVEEGRIPDLAGMFVDLPGVDGRITGTLELEGEPYELEGGARVSLRDVELFGERFPAGEAEGYMHEGEFTLQQLVLTRRGGAASILARGGVKRGYAANLEIHTDGMRLEDLDALRGLAMPVEGKLDLSCRVGGTLMAPKPVGRLYLYDVTLRDHPVADSRIFMESQDAWMEVIGVLAGGAAEVEGGVDLETGAYALDARMAGAPLHAFNPVRTGGGAADARVWGDLMLRGQPGVLPELAVDLDRVRIAWNDRVLENPAPWHYRQGPEGGTMGRLALEGGTKTALWAEGSWSRGREWDFQGGGTLDLAWARFFSPEVTRASGEAELALKTRGTPGGGGATTLDVSVRDATLETTWFPNAFDALEARLSFSPDRWSFEEVRARVGGGRFEGWGQIRTRNWIPRSYHLEGRLQGARVRYLDDLPPMVGDATLSFDGPVEDLVLSGDIVIDQMNFHERIDWESWVLELNEEKLTAVAPEESHDWFAMDIRVQADGTGRIRNNVGNARLSADLRVVGDTSRPGLVGDVRVLPGGRAYLKEREFEVTRGEIRFVDPFTFDPELDLLLESEVQSRERVYRIYYRITGPFSDWQTSATSEPSLSQADINWLLLFGATREELEEYGGLQGALAWESVDLLGHELGLNQGVQRIQEIGDNLFQVDRWDIVTGATARRSRSYSTEPRLVVEKDLQEPWDLTVTGEVNVVQIGDSYASLEKRLARRLYMTLFWSSVEYDRSLDIGGAYGTEFLVRWEMD